jgi:hypothetical protein
MVQGIAGNWDRDDIAGIMRGFGYLQDRLFLSALAAYALNRLVILPRFGVSVHFQFPWSWRFLHGHLDDILMMPTALPVVLWIQRQLKWRTHDEPPGSGEMAGHLLIWSVMCKIIGPYFLHIGVADPLDLLCFAVGGFGACAWWKYGGRRSDEAPT